MNIGAVTTSSVSAAVWAVATRTLTNWGSGIVTVTNAVNQTLAASGSLDLRPAAGFYVRADIGAGGGAVTVAPLLQLNDGTNTFEVAPLPLTLANGQSALIAGDSAVGPRISNGDGAHACPYCYHLETWKL
jgi:hypothetical protein